MILRYDREGKSERAEDLRGQGASCSVEMMKGKQKISWMDHAGRRLD